MATLSNPIEVCILRNNEIAVSRAVVSDSVLYERMKFTFPESWEGYTKTAVFRNGDITLSVILDGDSDLCTGTDECYIPHEVIKFPELTVSVFGILGDSRVTTPQAAIRVIQSGYGEGDEPSDPTPTEYQQLVNLATETKQIAQSVRTDADNGAFKGDKGDPFTYSDFTPEQLASLKGKDGADGKDGTNGKDGYTPQKGVDYFTEEDIAELNIPSVDQTYTPTSENAQSGKAVAEAVAAEQKRIDNISANAIKGAVSDSQVLLYDVSPIVHDMKVRVSSDSISDLSTVKLIKSNGSGETITEYIPNADGTVDGVTSRGAKQKNKSDIWDGSVSTGLQGTGSQEDPFMINSAADLAYIARAGMDVTKGKYYELQNDIYLNNVTTFKGDTWYAAENNPKQWFDTFDTTGKDFAGILNGKGHVIHGIYINDLNRENAGLFMYVRDGGGAINLGIEDSYIYAKNNVGAIFGHKKNWSNFKLSNCYSSDTVILTASGEGVGGLIGVLEVEGGVNYYDNTIENCYSMAQVSCSYRLGGLIGNFSSGNGETNTCITNCYSTQPNTKLLGGVLDIRNCTFKNNYSTIAMENISSSLTVAQMTGKNAYANMSGFDFNTVWYVEEYGLPKLRVFLCDVIELTTDTEGVKIYCEYNKDINNCMNGKENISNKTVSLTSKSTNTEYPTSKAVYDFVNQAAESERNYADGTFATIEAFKALKSIVDRKKVTYATYSQNGKIIIENSKVYIVKAYPSEAAINLWVTDSSGTETQAYSEDDSLFPNCSTGILISPETINGILFIGITGKLSITNLSPYYGRRFAIWKHSDIKNLFLKSTSSNGMAVWTIVL